MIKSIKKNKNDLLIIVSLVALSAVILFSLAPGSSDINQDLHSSNYSGYVGTKAFYMLCEELGYDIDRINRFESLSDECKVLMVVSPKIKLSDKHIEGLEKWVRNGGVLICDRALLPDDDLNLFHMFDSGTLDKEENILAHDIDKTSWMQLSAFNKEDLDDNYRILYHDDLRVRIVERVLDDGKIIRLAGPDIITNFNLHEDDNSVLAINLIHYSLGNSMTGSILFDESHYREYEKRQSSYTLLGTMLFNTPWGWFVVSLVVVGMCYIWLLGKRFGPVRQLPGQSRRAKLEYVQSAGACWSNAGANTVMFELNYKWLRDSFARSIGVASNCDNGTLALEIARRTEGDAEHYMGIFERSENAIARSLSKREISNLINELGKIELELSDGYRKGK